MPIVGYDYVGPAAQRRLNKFYVLAVINDDAPRRCRLTHLGRINKSTYFVVIGGIPNQPAQEAFIFPHHGGRNYGRQVLTLHSSNQLSLGTEVVGKAINKNIGIQYHAHTLLRLLCITHYVQRAICYIIVRTNINFILSYVV
jgi:hypothetical protein